MNHYPESEYPNLYEEILKDYYFSYGKFSPIPYPTLSNLDHAQQQRNGKITRASSKFARTN